MNKEFELRLMGNLIKELRERIPETCCFCGVEGIYGEDIVDTDYRDPVTGRDTVKPGCKDVESCFARGGSVYAKY